MEKAQLFWSSPTKGEEGRTKVVPHTKYPSVKRQKTTLLSKDLTNLSKRCLHRSLFTIVIPRMDHTSDSQQTLLTWVFTYITPRIDHTSTYTAEHDFLSWQVMLVKKTPRATLHATNRTTNSQKAKPSHNQPDSQGSSVSLAPRKSLRLQPLVCRLAINVHSFRVR